MSSSPSCTEAWPLHTPHRTAETGDGASSEAVDESHQLSLT